MIWVRDKSVTLSGTCPGLCCKVGVIEFGLYRAEMVAISIALQKIVELHERPLVPKKAHINVYTDFMSAIQKLAKATRKEKIVHHVLSLVEQIAAGGNAQMTFQ